MGALLHHIGIQLESYGDPTASYWKPIGIPWESFWDLIGTVLGSYWDLIGILFEVLPGS